MSTHPLSPVPQPRVRGRLPATYKMQPAPLGVHSYPLIYIRLSASNGISCSAVTGGSASSSSDDMQAGEIGTSRLEAAGTLRLRLFHRTN